MTGRERVLTTLGHTEPDRVPYDLGSTQVTGIAIRAWRALRRHLGLPDRRPDISDIIQQLACPEEDLLDRLDVDTRGLFPLTYANIPLPVGGETWRERHAEVDGGLRYVDEYGLTHFFPTGGLYYSLIDSPLPGMDVTVAQVEALPLPDGGEAWRFEGVRERARAFRDAGKAVVLKGPCAGLVEMGERIRGMENFLVDLLVNPPAAEALMERIAAVKVSYWTRAAEVLGDLVDVAMEADDYGTQESQLVSPELFRSLVKPKLKAVFDHVHERLPAAKLLFHSCGSVRPMIPDFIEMGVDVLNPVHITAAGMAPAGLKRDFGADVCFWGGGVQTQNVLPTGTPDQVRDDVRRNVEALAPGGGWVFNTVHNILPDVPPENVVAMREALAEYGVHA